MPSRGLTLEELEKSQLWFHGPLWLRDDGLCSEDVEETEEVYPQECLIELRTRESSAFVAIESGVNSLGSIMSIERFSSLKKLITGTAILL